MTEIMRILTHEEPGDAEATQELRPIYDQLRLIARRELSRKSGDTIRATALVHEAWLKLGGAQQKVWKNRAYFFGAAARAMEQILVDRWRKRMSKKRGGKIPHVSWEVLENRDDLPEEVPRDEGLIKVTEALGKFAKLDPAKAELVRLRYFMDLNFDEAAEVLEIAVPTAKHWWSVARAWLNAEMSADHPGDRE